ncbi:MAG: hypothetical protein QW175_07225 [Candidatus Bathyarchaeia archaeon]
MLKNVIWDSALRRWIGLTEKGWIILGDPVILSDTYVEKVLKETDEDADFEKQADEVLRFLQYLDKCAEEVRFLDPALEQARTGRYEQRKPPKPDKKREAQKPLLAVLADMKIPYDVKSRYFVDFLRRVAHNG